MHPSESASRIFSRGPSEVRAVPPLLALLTVALLCAATARKQDAGRDSAVTTGVEGGIDAAPPAEEVRWFALERAGTRIGWRRVRMRALDGGYREMQCEEVRRGRLPNGARSDMRIVQNCLVDGSWTVISLSAETEWMGKRLRLQAANDHGILHVTFEHADGRLDRRREDVRAAVPDVFLADMFAADTLSRGATSLVVLDTRAAVPVPLSVLRSVDADGRQQLRLGRRVQFTFGGDGAPAEESDLADDFEVRRADDAVRSDTAAFALPPLEHWSFLSADRLDDPANIRDIQVQLRFERGFPPDLSLDDLRQRAEAPEGSSVRLLLRHDEPGDAGVTIPVLDPTLLHFLGPTPLVSAHDEGITRVASDIRGRNRDAYVIARDMLAWVRQAVIHDPFVTGTSADRILDGRRADQRGIAVLLTALLRATGIPARVAAGQKATGESWLAGVWSEVWLGQWVPADPLIGDFITGATHLKLYDSSAPEQLPSGAAVPDRRIRLSILRSHARDSSAAGSLPTGVYGDVYSNRGWRCVLRAPAEEWEMEDRPRGGGAALTIRRHDDSSAVFELSLYLTTPDHDPMRQLDARLKAQEQLSASFTIVERGRMSLGGLEAPYAVATSRPTRGTEGETTSAHIVMVDGVNGYACTFRAPASRFATYRPLLERILRSFRIIRD